MSRSLVKQARHGKRRAMITLYRQHKDEIFFLAMLLLREKELATRVTVTVFCEIWDGVQDAQADTDEEFHALAVSLVIGECHRLITRRDPRAYRLPPNRDFSIRTDLLASDNDVPTEEFVLSRFNDVQRLLFVLHHLVRYRDEDAALILKMDTKTLSRALEAERDNAERLIRANDPDGKLSWEDVIAYFEKRQQEVTAPADVDDAVLDGIRAFRAPLKKQARRRRLRRAAIVAGICVVTVAFFALLVSAWNAIQDSIVAGD